MSRTLLLCLANSRKLGGRCIAGLRIDGGGWIRPVAEFPDGTLYPANYLLNDGSGPQLLDVIEIGLSRPRPASYQPENWVIDSSPWHLVRRPGYHQEIAMMWDNVIEDNRIFGTQGDRVPANESVRSSLALIRVCDLRWRITYFLGKRRTRALFSTCEQDYDLAVTDSVIEHILIHLEEGVHPISAAPGFAPEQEVLLTVSLGEPFQGDCYKLIAGIIRLV